MYNIVEIVEDINNVTIQGDSEIISVTQIERGEQGIQGLQGKSAYQVALDNGFVGTEQEWLDSLAVSSGILVNRIYLPTSQNIGGHRVLIATDTGVDYADNTNLAHINKILGMSYNAAVTGAQVSIITNGEIDGLSGLTIGSPLYVSTNGTFTQTPPNLGFIQKIGTAITATSALLNIQTPIQLI